MMILTLSFTYKWSLFQLDFSNGLLDEEVYMSQPPRFEAKHTSWL